MSLFTIDELLPKFKTAEQETAGKDASLSASFLAFHQRKISNVKQLAGKLPNWNEGLFLWTDRSFNAFTFIPFVIAEEGAIQELVVTTYSISIEILDSLVQLLDEGKIGKVSLFISDSLRHRIPRVNDHLQRLIQARPALEAHFAWNHSKVILIRTEWCWLVVEGSGNFAKNAQFEQYALFNNRELYEFRKQCIEDGFNAGATQGD